MEMKMVNIKDVKTRQTENVDVDNPVEVTYGRKAGRPKKTKMDVSYSYYIIDKSEVEKYKIVYLNFKRRMDRIFDSILDEGFDEDMMEKWHDKMDKVKKVIKDELVYVLNHPKRLDGRSKKAGWTFIQKMMDDSQTNPQF